MFFGINVVTCATVYSTKEWKNFKENDLWVIWFIPDKCIEKNIPTKMTTKSFDSTSQK